MHHGDSLVRRYDPTIWWAQKTVTFSSEYCQKSCLRQATTVKEKGKCREKGATEQSREEKGAAAQMNPEEKDRDGRMLDGSGQSPSTCEPSTCRPTPISKEKGVALVVRPAHEKGGLSAIEPTHQNRGKQSNMQAPKYSMVMVARF